MRKSVKKNDPGYDAEAHKYTVYFNGEKLDNCFTADEEKGEAWVYALNRDGDFIIDNGEMATKCLSGKVTIILDSLS